MNLSENPLGDRTQLMVSGMRLSERYMSQQAVWMMDIQNCWFHLFDLMKENCSEMEYGKGMS